MNNLTENNQNKEQIATPIIVKRSWAKTVSTIGVTLILVFGAIYIFKYMMELPGKGVDKIANRVIDIAKAFKKGTIINEFRSYATSVSATNYLQIAKLSTHETFSKTDSKMILWDQFYLGDIKVEIRAPVEYTFFVDLNENWQFILKDKEMEVMILAPKIQVNKPFIDISNLTISSEKSILRRGKSKIEEQLRKEIVGLTKVRARGKIKLIRAIAKDMVAQFVQNWFINVQYKDNKTRPHVKAVYFANQEYPKKIFDDMSGTDKSE